MTRSVRQVLLGGLLAGLLSGCSWLLPFDGADQSGDGWSGEASLPADGGGNEGPGGDLSLTDGGPDGQHEGGVGTDGSGPAGDTRPDAPPPSCIEQCKATGGWCPTPTGVTEHINDVAGPGPGELWAVGDNLTLLRFDPGLCQWNQVPGPVTPSAGSAFTGVWGVSGSEVFVLSGDGPYRWTGGWTKVDQACGGFTVPALTTVVGAPFSAAKPAEIYVAGPNGFIARWEPTGTCWKPLSSGTSSPLNALAWGDGKFYAGGNGVLLRQQDATSFGTHGCTVAGNLYGLWASSSGALIGVGQQLSSDYVLIDDPASIAVTCQDKSLSLTIWRDVAGTALNNAWLVGDKGWIVHRTGPMLSPVQPLAPTNLRAVWVNPDQSKPLVVAAGEGGKIWIHVP